MILHCTSFTNVWQFLFRSEFKYVIHTSFSVFAKDCVLKIVYIFMIYFSLCEPLYRMLKNISTLWVGKFFAQIFQIWFGLHQQIQNQISIIGQESIPGFANQLSLLKRRKIKLRKDLMSHIFTSHSIVRYQITNHVELIRFLGGFCRWFGIFGFSFYSPSRLFSNNSWHRGLNFWSRPSLV